MRNRVVHFTTASRWSSIIKDERLRVDKAIVNGVSDVMPKGVYAFYGFDIENEKLLRKMISYLANMKSELQVALGGEELLREELLCLVFDYFEDDWSKIDLEGVKKSDLRYSPFTDDEKLRIGNYLCSTKDVLLTSEKNLDIIKFSDW